MNERSYERGTDAATCDARIVDEGAVSRVLGTLPPQIDRDRLSGVFAALADPTRVRVLLALAAEPLCVCELTEIAGVSQSAVSHQLRLLRELDLVAWDRDGKRAVYRLADDHVRVLLEIGLEHAREGDTR
jgi:DNA-binding transcriptional ArsR family regulator